MTDPDLRAAITEALADPDIDGTLAACLRGALAVLHLEIDVPPALRALSGPIDGLSYPRWQIVAPDGELLLGEYSWLDGGDDAVPDWAGADHYEVPVVAHRVQLIDRVTRQPDDDR